jgi:Zn-finger nucleic acid-binding protein
METEGALTCPQCDAELNARSLGSSLGSGQVYLCPRGHGVFLPRIELGALIESETDWHRLATQNTAPIPRITADMEAPPASKAHARAWVESLFG